MSAMNRRCLVSFLFIIATVVTLNDGSSHRMRNVDFDHIDDFNSIRNRRESDYGDGLGVFAASVQNTTKKPNSATKAQVQTTTASSASQGESDQNANSIGDGPGFPPPPPGGPTPIRANNGKRPLRGPGKGQKPNPFKAIIEKSNKENGPKPPDQFLVKLFENFMKKFNKSYGSDEVRQKRLGFFRDAFEKIANLNDKNEDPDSAKFAITKFADEPLDEFMQNVAGTLLDKVDGSFSLAKASGGAGKSLDWRKFGIFPPIRDQKSCGSCYSFAAADLIIAQSNLELKRFNQKSVDPLSSQYILDCMSEPAAYGCKGGRPAAVMKKLENCSQSNCEIPLESCYPYQDKQATCKPANNSKSCHAQQDVKPKWSTMLQLNSSSEMDTVGSLLQWGPALAVVSLSEAWQYYNGTGVLRASNCDNTTQTQSHAVLIVGYDFTTTVPYYIIRNTWNTNWGDNGYAKLEAGRNACSVATSALFVCIKNSCDKISGADYLAKHSNVPK